MLKLGDFVSSYLSPPFNTIFAHERPCHGRRDLCHMVSVFLFAHAWSTITQYGQTEILASLSARGVGSKLFSGHHEDLISVDRTFNLGSDGFESVTNAPTTSLARRLQRQVFSSAHVLAYEPEACAPSCLETRPSLRSANIISRNRDSGSHGCA